MRPVTLDALTRRPNSNRQRDLNRLTKTNRFTYSYGSVEKHTKAQAFWLFPVPCSYSFSLVFLCLLVSRMKLLLRAYHCNMECLACDSFPETRELTPRASSHLLRKSYHSFLHKHWEKLFQALPFLYIEPTAQRQRLESHDRKRFAEPTD